jgi:hypothetical protein
MYFDIAEYRFFLTIIQIGWFAFGVLILIGALYTIYRNVFNPKTRKRAYGGMLFLIFTIMLFNATVYNLKYGLPLLNVYDSDIKSIEGEITNLEPAKQAPRFTYNGEYVSPYIVTINETEFYIMTIGTFKENDKVIISVYENTRVIIKIEGT